MAADSQLSYNEQCVLYGLVQHSEYSDNKLADQFKLKLPTVTSIRRRMFGRGYIDTTLRIPDLHSLGCTILSTAHFSYHPSQITSRQLEKLAELIKSLPEIIWAINSPGQHVFFQFGSSYADLRYNLVKIEEFLALENIIIRPGIQMEVFPFSLCDELVFFDFAPALKLAFEPNIAEIKKHDPFRRESLLPGKVRPVRKDELSETERQIFCALVEYPELSDRDLADVIAFSRYTIGRVRNKFETTGLLRKQYVPHLVNLGINVLLYSYAPYNLAVPPARRHEILAEVFDIIPSILEVQTEYEVMSVDVYRSFEEYHEVITRLTPLYKESSVFFSTPTRFLFALPTKGIWWKLDFGPLVRKLLGLATTDAPKSHRLAGLRQ